jgi:hypothetical protein
MSSPRKRRCTERCWNARGKRCQCVCGGKNHGTQLDLFLDNNHENQEGGFLSCPTNSTSKLPRSPDRS